MPIFNFSRSMKQNSIDLIDVGACADDIIKTTVNGTKGNTIYYTRTEKGVFFLQGNFEAVNDLSANELIIDFSVIGEDDFIFPAAQNQVVIMFNVTDPSTSITPIFSYLDDGSVPGLYTVGAMTAGLYNVSSSPAVNQDFTTYLGFQGRK